jgi:aryl-alcohol dehydrogenase-like predicted oxidoreductase
MPALALAWVHHHPQVTAALIGPRSPEQLDAAIESLRVALTGEDRDRILDRMLARMDGAGAQ